MKNREGIIRLMLNEPAMFGRMVGFSLLNDTHNEWIKKMVRKGKDHTLQAFRGSYKTTCVSLAIAIILLLYPESSVLFMRKTDEDVKEVIRQVQKILLDDHISYIVKELYGLQLKMLTQSSKEVITNLRMGTSGVPQLLGIGTSGSITGKHFDWIFTDDIVNVNDRVSKTERERIKLIYQELQNVRNKDGRIFNTGTPWHKDDCFSIMPDAEKWDVDSMDILSEEKKQELRDSMLPSLYAANYELKHIASEDIIFPEPQLGGDPSMCEQGLMQMDAAFYGEDYTAWTIMNRHDGKYYVYGKMRRKHVEECYNKIAEDYNRFNVGKMYNETNADKGMVARDLRNLHGLKVVTYNEDMNKYLKIVTYLKAIWKDVIFVDGTDDEYIEQITEFNENAPHDDAPDSLASLARVLYKKNRRGDEYKPLWNRGI